MNESNSIEAIDKTNLTVQTKFRLSEIIGIENYFYQKINQRKSCFTSIVGVPVGIASASFALIFSLATGIVKKILNITRNKKKKHDKILMLAKSKLNSIETLISQALIDMEISHEEFITILK